MGIERVNSCSQGLSQKTTAEKRISEQEKLKKAAEQMKYEQSKMEQAEESMRAEQEGMKIRMTCLEISRRIISGDEVPREDHKYLMKHDMELYARSITMRRHKEDPHEYDQLSEDENFSTPQNTMDTETSSGSESTVPVPKLDVSI